MAAGLVIRNASNVVVWDSTTVVGGVFTLVKKYTAVQTEVATFPLYAGTTPVAVSLLGDGEGMAVDTALGYPRLTVSAGNGDREIAMMMY